MNIDHGALPGCSVQIQKKLNISDLGFGLLGTFVYLGLSIGSIIGAKVFTKTKYIKTILSISLIFSAVTLLVFAFTTNFELALLMRVAAGFFEVFITIFTPVWADTFGS